MNQQLSSHFFKKIPTLIVLVFVLFCHASDALAQGEVKDKFANWNLHCETPIGAKSEHCTLIQSVISEEQSNVRMRVILLKTADNGAHIMRILTPLGIILPSGLGLYIDGRDMGRASYVRCIIDGCVAEVIMPSNLIEELKNGKVATFTVYLTPEEGIGIPVSLEGLSEGFDALK